VDVLDVVLGNTSHGSAGWLRPAAAFSTSSSPNSRAATASLVPKAG
jgi:hypothetical protein